MHELIGILKVAWICPPENNDLPYEERYVPDGYALMSIHDSETEAFDFAVDTLHSDKHDLSEYSNKFVVIKGTFDEGKDSFLVETINETERTR